MQIDKNCKLEKVAGSTKMNARLAHIMIGDNVAYATNGIALAVVECAVGKGDKLGPIRQSALSYARSIAEKDEPVVIDLNDKGYAVCNDAAKFPRSYESTHSAGEKDKPVEVDTPFDYPDVLTCLPVLDGSELFIRINPCVLKELAEALGDASSIGLYIPVKKRDKDGRYTGAVRVMGETNKRYGLIMLRL